VSDSPIRSALSVRIYRCADMLFKIQVSAIRRHVVWYAIFKVLKTLSASTCRRMTYNVYLDLPSSLLWERGEFSVALICCVGTSNIHMLVTQIVASIANELKPLVNFKYSK
jgi:hypothetical protein